MFAIVLALIASFMIGLGTKNFLIGVGVFFAIFALEEVISNEIEKLKKSLINHKD